MKVSHAAKVTLMSGIIAVSMLEAPAAAQSISSSFSTNGTVSTLTMTVTPLPGQKVKDFHLRRPTKKARFRPASGVTVLSHTNWEAKQVTSSQPKAGFSFWGGDNGAAATSASPLKIQITYTHASGKEPTRGEVNYIGTNTGNQTPSTDRLPRGPTTWGGRRPRDFTFWSGPGRNGPAAEVPLLSITYNNPVGMIAEVGAQLPFSTSTDMEDNVFTVHSSEARSQTIDGADDPLGIGIDTARPIPSSWGIDISQTRDMYPPAAFGPSVGTFLINIPNDQNLVGRIFYVVVSLDTDGNGLPDLFTRIMKITIHPQGSPQSGIEFIDQPEP